jgi:hypothetical protein
MLHYSLLGFPHFSTAHSNHIKTVLDNSYIYLVSCFMFTSQRSDRPTQTDPTTPSSSSSVRLSARKSRRIRTYRKHACNPFRIRTSQTHDLKPFRINTYEKKGVGPLPSVEFHVGQPIFAVSLGLPRITEHGHGPRPTGSPVPLRRTPQSARITLVTRLLLVGDSSGNISAPPGV